MQQELTATKKRIKSISILQSIALIILLLLQSFAYAQKPRARDIGIPFNGTPGKYNAITDVKGIEVGYSNSSKRT